ncbi:hypothetical protein RHOSPDRAFT_16775 [Rhodotorula sp. JG-1b]|nr:hypothetical protein RHOSPDRAFT_16775 [Rhodotorula sp. JG-1b]
MLTRSIVPSTRAILHRAFLSTSRPAPSPPPAPAPAPAAAPAHPTSTRTTQDALYADRGPSAAAENATQPASFPYGQPLASSSSTPPPSPAPVTTATTAEQAPSQLPLGLEPEQPVQEAPVSRSRRPVGAFRGGIIGFLLGLTAVGGYGYLRVLDDYRQASEKLLTSVEELKISTEQMTAHLSRINALETSLDRLARQAAKTQQVDSLRDETRQLIESHHLDLLNLKAHVWGIEQDLRNLSKRDTSVRI